MDAIVLGLLLQDMHRCWRARGENPEGAVHDHDRWVRQRVILQAGGRAERQRARGLLADAMRDRRVSAEWLDEMLEGLRWWVADACATVPLKGSR